MNADGCGTAISQDSSTRSAADPAGTLNAPVSQKRTAAEGFRRAGCPSSFLNSSDSLTQHPAKRQRPVVIDLVCDSDLSSEILPPSVACAPASEEQRKIQGAKAPLSRARGRTRTGQHRRRDMAMAAVINRFSRGSFSFFPPL